MYGVGIDVSESPLEGDKDGDYINIMTPSSSNHMFQIYMLVHIDCIIVVVV